MARWTIQEQRTGRVGGATVVVDRGMAFDDNLAQIQTRGHHYLVARRPGERLEHLEAFEDETGWTEVHRTPSPRNPGQRKTHVVIKRRVVGAEIHILCRSDGRTEKPRPGCPNGTFLSAPALDPVHSPPRPHASCRGALMILVIGLGTFLRALLFGAAAIALENLALRHQLAVLPTTTVPSHESSSLRHVAGSSPFLRWAGCITATSAPPNRGRAGSPALAHSRYTGHYHTS